MTFDLKGKWGQCAVALALILLWLLSAELPPAELPPANEERYNGSISFLANGPFETTIQRSTDIRARTRWRNRILASGQWFYGEWTGCLKNQTCDHDGAFFGPSECVNTAQGYNEILKVTQVEQLCGRATTVQTVIIYTGSEVIIRNYTPIDLLKYETKNR